MGNTHNETNFSFVFILPLAFYVVINVVFKNVTLDGAWSELTTMQRLFLGVVIAVYF